MQPIRPEEILPAAEYERVRPELRRRVMRLKACRRVPLGEHATIHFETRETMLYQVHEMLRAEGSWDRPGAVEAELAAYNPLVPAGEELSATLMIEYEDVAQRAALLTALVGIEEHLWLQVGDTSPVQALFDRAQIGDRRISSVQYLKFPLSLERRQQMRREGTVVKVILDHPAMPAQAVLGEETRRELARDLD